MSGIPSVIIRFICHIPLGFLASNGMGMYNQMKDLGSIYDDVPHGQSFLQGARIIGGVGWPLFAYNFVCFGLTGFLSGLWLATIGLIDLVFTITLIAGTAMLANFLPRTYGDCNSAYEWRDGPGGRNFFSEAVRGGQWNGYRKAEDLCHGMVQHWAFCIAATIIYGISACINLAIGLRQHHTDRRFSRTRGACLPSSLLPRPVAFVMRHFAPSFIFIYHYAGRFFARWRRLVAQPYEYRELLGLTARGELGSEPSLPFKVASFLAEELHFVEVLNLATSTTQMGAMLLGTKNPLRQLEELRPFTCAGMDKFQCRVCDAQLCSDCDTIVPLPKTQAARHLELCQPCCARCFYNSHCRRARTSPLVQGAKHNKTCVLGGGDRDVEKAGGEQDEKSEGSVCRTCAAMSPQDRKAALEARDIVAVRRLAQFPMLCGLCKEPLAPSGPRWWRCSVCRGECPSSVHPPWQAGR